MEVLVMARICSNCIYVCACVVVFNTWVHADLDVDNYCCAI